MLLSLFLIFIGIFGVSFGARILVSGGSSIARRLRVSDLVVGLTIVALGTSAPELIVGLNAAWNGKAEVALGNVIGSNIANVGLILAVCALITPLYFQRNTVRAEIPLTLLAALVCLLLSQDVRIDGRGFSAITRIDGLVLLCFFAIYMAYMFNVASQSPKQHPDTAEHPILPVWRSVGMIAGGIVALALGGDWIVGGASDVARRLGMSDALISLTLVSVGTSIPELATSLVAAMRRNTDIVVGNVVGSNLFNSFLILGSSATLAPLPLGNITLADFLVNIGVTVYLTAIAFFSTPSRITRLEGGILLAIYLAYVAYLFKGL